MITDTSRSSSNTIAEYGQLVMHVLHALHRSGMISEVIGSRTYLPRSARDRAQAAAAAPWATESGMSFGPWQAPAK
jgi:hypothetical protein